MIFYKPVSEIEKVKEIYVDFSFDDDCIYGSYIGIDEDSNEVGRCLVKIDKYSYLLQKRLFSSRKTSLFFIGKISWSLFTIIFLYGKIEEKFWSCGWKEMCVNEGDNSWKYQYWV